MDDVRQSLLALPLVFLAFFVFSLLTKHWVGILVISGLSLLGIAVIAVELLRQKGELRKMGVSGLNVSSATSAQAASGRDKEYVVPSRFAHFSSLAVPRRMKMKRIFFWLTILLSIIALAFTDATYSLLTPPYKSPEGLIAVGIYLGMFWSWWREIRRKQLLRSGQVTFGQVLESNAGTRALLPGVTYKFHIENGDEIEDFDHDWTDSYHKEMIVPVFYDSARPENHVAMCASFYDVL